MREGPKQTTTSQALKPLLAACHAFGARPDAPMPNAEPSHMVSGTTAKTKGSPGANALEQAFLLARIAPPSGASLPGALRSLRFKSWDLMERWQAPLHAAHVSRRAPAPK